MFRRLIVGLFALALPMAAAASAIVQSVRGPVDAGGAPIVAGQRIFPGTNITTGSGAQLFLKFDDGMQIVLHEGSYFRLIDFRHSDTGATDRAVFELHRGAARVVTGKVARDNPQQFFFRTPQTELRVEQPSDFTVALVNPAYITVHAGRISAYNGYGVTQLGAGSTTAVATGTSMPVTIAPSALPPSAASATASLGGASVTPVAGGAATGVGTGAAGGAAISLPGVAAAAAAMGIGIAAGKSKGRNPIATTTHH